MVYSIKYKRKHTQFLEWETASKHTSRKALFNELTEWNPNSLYIYTRDEEINSFANKEEFIVCHGEDVLNNKSLK